jgi:hypothetical protein
MLLVFGAHSGVVKNRRGAGGGARKENELTVKWEGKTWRCKCLLK